MITTPVFNLDTTIDQTNYYWFEKALSPEELDFVNNLKELFPYAPATIIGAEQPDDSIRKSRVKWITHNEQSSWLYDKLAGFAIEANNAQWKFDLHSVIDSIQYTEYEEDGGHYSWHIDIGPGSINHRKISITIQLSGEDEYEGGEFELWNGGEFKTLPKIKGCAILFPSFLMHRVTPITKGTRKSLVLWVGGGSYK